MKVCIAVGVMLQLDLTCVDAPERDDVRRPFELIAITHTDQRHVGLDLIDISGVQ
jgi:hypothetical protein